MASLDVKRFVLDLRLYESVPLLRLGERQDGADARKNVAQKGITVVVLALSYFEFACLVVEVFDAPVVFARGDLSDCVRKLPDGIARVS